MEYIPVILADLSQLSRLGIISLLNQMKYPFHIREISSPEKLSALMPRETDGLIILSRAFLGKCSPSILKSLPAKLHSTACILINDGDNVPENQLEFADVIDVTDHDKAIIRKLDKQLSLISSQKQISDITEDISEREKDVLRLVAIGLTNREIADKLFISTHTVITHRKNITKKLGIKTIAGLTMYALINRLIIPEEIN